MGKKLMKSREEESYHWAPMHYFEIGKIRSKSKPSLTPTTSNGTYKTQFFLKKQCWESFSKIIETRKKICFTLNLLKKTHCKDDVGTYLVMVMCLP